MDVEVVQLKTAFSICAGGILRMEDAKNSLADNGPKIYTAADVARILQTTRRSVYSYIKSGKLKTIRIGGQHRVTQAGLEEFLKGE